MSDTNIVNANTSAATENGAGSCLPETSCSPEQALDKQYEAGSYVTFGRYQQNNGDAPEPIEWEVLESDGKTALLLSKYGLDCQRFNNNKGDITWRDCSLRKWLNYDFLRRAFNSEEQSQIADSKIFTAAYPESATNGCGETIDKVFCLSADEVYKFFGNTKENYGCSERWYSKVRDENIWINRDRACTATEYAFLQGAKRAKVGWDYHIQGKPSEWWFDNCEYWLRSSGSYDDAALYVTECGWVKDNCGVEHDRFAVRPALRIILSGNSRESSGGTRECAHDAPVSVMSALESAQRVEARVGQYVMFGSYPQNNGDTPEPIEWEVLESDGKTALLLAKYGLDHKWFHQQSLDTCWRECDLRKWLNREFLEKAFNSDEQRQIAKSKIFTGDNPETGLKGCGETIDKVFCLSIEEAWKYFGNVRENFGCAEIWRTQVNNAVYYANRFRACKATAYAMKNGARQGKDGYIIEGKAHEWWFDNCEFWLRSPGDESYKTVSVNCFGAVLGKGGLSNFSINAVRPALRIYLSRVSNSANASEDVSAVSYAVHPDPEQSGPVPPLSSEARAGSYVTFGRYPQKSNSFWTRLFPEPIEWLVLESDGNTALLLAKHSLDCKLFHQEKTRISWRDCDLRKWLNGKFLSKAFKREERCKILDSKIYTGENPFYGTKSCGETIDKVFCLSIEEAYKYFDSDEARTCSPTNYAVSNGASSRKQIDGGCYWLRTPGQSADIAARIVLVGSVSSRESIFPFAKTAVRPAVRVRIGNRASNA